MKHRLLSERFELPETWRKEFLDDPMWVAKHRLMESMIPARVRTILDVGCGNGAQAEILSAQYDVTGFDASEIALRHTSVPRVRGLSNILPFPSHSYDLVWSSQMLEHLPDDTLLITIKEMQRVSRGPLLISVPNQENLRARACRCHSCRGLFHVYGHLQSFELNRLRRLMQPLTLQSWAFCGDEALLYHPLLLSAKHVLGRQWFSLPDALPICPYCGHHEQEVWFGNRIARWCNRLNDVYVSQKSQRSPFWVVTLWRAGQ